MSACDEDQKDLIEQEAKEEVAQEKMPEPEPQPELTSFNITITNVVNYLNAIVFNTHNNTMEPGPIPDLGVFLCH